MTCSRPQRNVHRPGFEPGTPWSEIRRPNHSATPPPFANLRKTIIYITDVDLVNDNEYTKFSLILSIRSQVIELKPNSGMNQGPQLCCKFATTTFYNTEVDHVNDDVYKKFGLILSIRSQDIE